MYSYAVIAIDTQKDHYDFQYSYDNEIIPELNLDNNWIDKINSKDNILSLIEKSFLDIYCDMDDNEVSENLSQIMSDFGDEEKYQELIQLIENTYNEKINSLLLGVAAGPGETAYFEWIKYDFGKKKVYSEKNKDTNSVNANQQEQFLERAIQNAISYKIK